MPREPRLRWAWAAVALAAVLCTAGAAPLLDPDLLTCSGRMELPKAKGSPLEARLAVSELVVGPGGAERFGMSPADYKAVLVQAISKSLANHGYSGAPAASGVASLVIEAQPVEVAGDAEGQTATARLRIRAAAGTAPCFPFEARGVFGD